MTDERINEMLAKKRNDGEDGGMENVKVTTHTDHCGCIYELLVSRCVGATHREYIEELYAEQWVKIVGCALHPIARTKRALPCPSADHIGPDESRLKGSQDD